MTIPLYDPMNPPVKMDFCLYCKIKVESQITIHLAVCHRQEEDVAAALVEPIYSKEREIKMNKIVNEGNFMYNSEVSDGRKNTSNI